MQKSQPQQRGLQLGEECRVEMGTLGNLGNPTEEV